VLEHNDAALIILVVVVGIIGALEEAADDVGEESKAATELPVATDEGS